MTPLPRTRAVPLVLALLLAGCAPMGPDYRRPSLEIAPQFRAQAQAQAASLADQPWWQVFADPALQALAKPYTLEEMAARLREAMRGRGRQAR